MPEYHLIVSYYNNQNEGEKIPLKNLRELRKAADQYFGYREVEKVSAWENNVMLYFFYKEKLK